MVPGIGDVRRLRWGQMIDAFVASCYIGDMLTIVLIIAAPLAIIALPAPAGHAVAAIAVGLLALREWRQARRSAVKQHQARQEALTAAENFHDSVSAYALLQARSRPVKSRSPAPGGAPSDH